MSRRCFTVDGHLEIRDEDGHVLHQEAIARRDVWDDGGVYKTYLKCLQEAKSELLTASKEHEIRFCVCRICPTCKRTDAAR